MKLSLVKTLQRFSGVEGSFSALMDHIKMWKRKTFEFPLQPANIHYLYYNGSILGIVIFFHCTKRVIKECLL